MFQIQYDLPERVTLHRHVQTKDQRVVLDRQESVPAEASVEVINLLHLTSVVN